jgi:hypothetical protein
MALNQRAKEIPTHQTWRFPGLGIGPQQDQSDRVFSESSFLLSRRGKVTARADWSYVARARYLANQCAAGRLHC